MKKIDILSNMKKFGTAFIAFTLFWGLWAGVSETTYAQTTVTLSPTKDALLSSYGPNNNYGINSELLLRRDGDDYVSLIQFDLSSIPSNATITNAQLQLYKYDETTSAATVNVHAMKQAWVEGTKNSSAPADGATWNTYNGTNAWQTAGAAGANDYESTVAATQSVGALGSYSWTITGLVQGWYSSPATNKGLIMRHPGGTEVLSRFRSREYTTTPSEQPKLSVTYTTPPTPVELVSFNAKVRNNVVLLDWRTATEVNNYGFEVERSSNSKTWDKIGFINGHGNSNSPKEYFFEDSKLSNSSYQYRLRQVDNDGSFAYSNIVSVSLNQVPDNFALYQNYPNPFNPGTKISWQSPVSGWQTLKVYDILGNEVATLVDEFREAGFYEVEFSANGGSASGRNAYSLTSGVYIYKIQADDFSDTRKMLLTK